MVRILPLAAALLILAVLTTARTLPKRSKQVKVYSYVLPAGAEEIRDDINHSFACANRTDGFYVDIDNDCQIFHRCQDNARFSFICAERTVFSQMYQTCVHDGQLGYPCEESVQYYPDGEGYEPSASGSDAAEETPQVEEMQPEQQASPAQELEAPAAPTKSVEAIAPSENTATSAEETPQDNVQQPSEQAESAVEVNDEPEQQQEEETHHQVNADLFDPIEEESEVPSENSAQEVMDEAEVSSPSAVPSETISADPAKPQEEESNEVEVTDETTSQQEVQQSEREPQLEQEPQPEQEPQSVQEPQSEQEQVLSSEPSPSAVLSDATSQDVVVEAEQPVNTEMETQGTPADSEAPVTSELDNETQYQADSLLNAVQMVEELEPIVHELAVETDELKPLVAEIVQDPAPNSSQEDNELPLPESDTSATANMEAPQMTLDASSTSSDSEPTAATLESDTVNELLPVDDASNAIDTISVEADETATPASEPETVADVKQPSESEATTPAEQSIPSTADEQERPMESPAFVEEMAPLRPNDSADLPELIVSTEFHLDAITQGPPIRRRKTFLFRADAIRSRH